MLKLRPTKNLLGITILGDHEDLNALRDAISDFTNLYMSNQESPDAYNCYECILGLCYDLRHAFQGDRGYESVPNNADGLAAFAECLYELPADAKRSIARDRRLYKNGNLYFSADILFPWAIYYLYVLQAISDAPCQSSWFDNIDFDYDEFRAERDAALIRYFVQLLWECVLTLLPSDVFHVIWDYTRTFAHTEFYISYPDLYLEWLCHYWAIAAKSRETRVSLLPMLFLELTPICLEDEENLLEDNDTDDPKLSSFIQSINQNTLKALQLYDEYYTLSQEACSVPFQDLFGFEAELGDYIDENGPFTQDTFDEYCDRKLGEVDWDRIEW